MFPSFCLNPRKLGFLQDTRSHPNDPIRKSTQSTPNYNDPIRKSTQSTPNYNDPIRKSTQSTPNYNDPISKSTQITPYNIMSLIGRFHS